MSVATLPSSAAAPVASAQSDEAARSRPADRPVEPRMKVCVLAACPFPANHGTPGSIRELSEATAERGHELHVVAYHFGDDMPLKGVHLHRIKDRTGERQVRVGPTKYRPLYDFQMILKTIEVVRRYDVDLIHAHSYEAALAAACAKPFVRKPILYSAHCAMGDELASYGFFSSRRFAEGLAWTLDRTVPRIGDRCLPHSTNLQAFLYERGLADRTEPVLNFGIDTDAIETGDRVELRRKLGIGDEPVVVYSGVTDQFQRLDLLLGAMRHVVRRDPRAKLIILSSIKHEEHERALLDEAARLGIGGNVVIRVPSSMQKGLKLLAIADVAVVPRPAAPGFPIKLLNYMAAGRACVLFKSSASRVAHGEHVWLAARDTAESLGEAITRVLRDPTLRRRIGEGGHRFVREHHDRRAVAASLCAAYQRVIEPTRRWEEVSRRPPPRPAWDAGALDETLTDGLDATTEMQSYRPEKTTPEEAPTHATK